MDMVLRSADVLLFYGPPNCGKTLFFTTHLKDEGFTYVCPSRQLKDDTDITLRQLILSRIIAPLREGKKVVIDDDNGTFTKRDSYICLIKKKVPGSKVVCLNFAPRLGQTQLLWSREYAFAARVGRGDTCICSNAESTALIKTWMEDKGSLDPPRMTEGYESILDIKRDFQVELQYNFQWACMFLQWEAVVSGDTVELIELAPGVTETIIVWADQNPTGRVVIIVDHNAFDSGTLVERKRAIKSIMRSITDSVSSIGVYVLYVRDILQSGSFSAPPSPGIIAFLQRLLHLNLTHKSSVYVYNSHQHMKMAEKAGVKYIKASRLLSRPALAKGSHAFTTVSIPDLLRNLLIVVDESTEPQSLPLLDVHQTSTAKPYLNEVELGCGRSMYLTGQSTDLIERYGNLCAAQAKSAEVPSTERRPSLPTEKNRSTELRKKNEVPTLTRQDTLTTQRDLPKWMKPKQDEYRDYKPKLKAQTSRTEYVMTPDELLATARLIIAEGGDALDEERTDTVQQMTNEEQKSTPTPPKPKLKQTIISPFNKAKQKEETASGSSAVKQKPVIKDIGRNNGANPPQNRSVRQSTTIIDDLFDDESRKPRPPPPAAGKRPIRARQSFIDDFLSPTKRKKTDKDMETSKTPSSLTDHENRPSKPAQLKRNLFPDSSSLSMVTAPIINKTENYVPDTTSADFENDSIIFSESQENSLQVSQEDSLQVSDSMSQEDSLVLYNSDEEGNINEYTNLKYKGSPKKYRR